MDELCQPIQQWVPISETLRFPLLKVMGFGLFIRMLQYTVHRFFMEQIGKQWLSLLITLEIYMNRLNTYTVQYPRVIQGRWCLHTKMSFPVYCATL